MESPNLRETISQIKVSKRLLGSTSMKDIIEASTHFNVIQYSEEYKPLLKELAHIGRQIVEKHSSIQITRNVYEKYKGKQVNAFRNNEVGDYCELLFSDVFHADKKHFREITSVSRLGGKGYPDLKIGAKPFPIFLEVKATSRPGKGSARDFYYSPGAASEAKIDSDALHILIGFVTKQASSGFLLMGSELVDVSKIKVSLKPEFNTDNLGIYNHETIIRL